MSVSASTPGAPRAWPWWMPSLATGALLLMWERSGLDWQVALWMGDANGFFLADNAFLSTWLHTGARQVLLLAAVALIATAIRPWGPWRRYARADLCWAIGTTLASALLIATLKHFSRTSCPWDLSAFGGTLPYIPHWQPSTDGGPGKCFPAGHASAAFAFLPYYFLFASAASTRTLARGWLIGVLALGAVLGTTQQLRGAHFTSHTLWTAWLCWSLASLSWQLRKLHKQRHPS